MGKTTEIMYGIFDGNSVVAIYPDWDQAQTFAEYDQEVERIRVDITRVKPRS